jgi:hypothetical protein
MGEWGCLVHGSQDRAVEGFRKRGTWPENASVPERSRCERITVLGIRTILVAGRVNMVRELPHSVPLRAQIPVLDKAPSPLGGKQFDVNIRDIVARNALDAVLFGRLFIFIYPTCAGFLCPSSIARIDKRNDYCLAFENELIFVCS